MPKRDDLNAFYALLHELEARIGGRRRLADCHGRQTWPLRGVYFFFEPGEFRRERPGVQRVVRVGTHGLTATSRTSLWQRLHQHRGTSQPPGGNHRGSIFRLLVGEALMNRETAAGVESWGRKKGIANETRARERAHEMKVSQHLGEMGLLWLDVPDPPGHDSLRGAIERNSIALLSGYREAAPDQPSAGWLGHHSGRERVRQSGLWNNNHVDEGYDPAFLGLFAALVHGPPTP